jgi:hypothetical protein
MNIGIGVVCWIETDEQLPELKRCLESLESFYPVFLVNGKWSDMSGDNPRSTDKANDLIDSYSNIIHIQSPNQPEFINRNKCLELAMIWNCDYLIWVDTDEWLEMPLGKDFMLRGIEDHKFEFVSYVHYYSDIFGGSCKQRRLLKYPSFLRHRLRHNELFFGDYEVYKNCKKTGPRGFIIHQDKNYRSVKREQNMLIRNRENPIH